MGPFPVARPGGRNPYDGRDRSDYAGGRYTVLYDGEGMLDFEWDARIIDSSPGRMELWVTPEIGMHVVIRETNPDDYIRNIRVIMPGFDETYEEEPFHPTYIQFLRQFSVLRFMDWADTNEPENNVPEVGEWSARITPDHATQGTIRGVALEYMIRMANRVGADPWISVPVVATDDYVENMAAVIRDSLSADRKVYVEFSNEMWNPSFPQHQVATDLGTGLSDPAAAARFQFIFPDPAGFVDALRFHSQRSIEVFQIFQQVFSEPRLGEQTAGERPELVRVMGGWLTDSLELTTDVAEVILDWQQAYTEADAYAVAFYFGIGLASEELVPVVEAKTVEAILDTATTEMRFLLGISQELRDLTEARGLELVTYEAGQHMVQASETPYPTSLVEEKLTAAQSDPRMNEIYIEFLNGWVDIGGGHMNLFNDSLPLGSFGLVNRWTQNIDTAHRYRAVQDFLTTGIPGDGDGDGDLDLDDFLLFALAFSTSDPLFDLNSDGIVNFFDLFQFASLFQAGS